LPVDELRAAGSPRARDLRREQTARLAVSEKGDALPEGARDDAGEYLPETWKKDARLQEMRTDQPAAEIVTAKNLAAAE
jgi:hypothetical protein